MANDVALLDEALHRLSGPTMSIAEAKVDVPARPGLYAVHGTAAVWRELGLGEPTDARPLYVGKAERSLASRDVATHFSTGKTGSSTLRRSLAGLLADQLALEGRPRNPAKPERFANFGLEESGDGRLTSWMVSHLRLAVWPSRDGAILDLLETAVLAELLPPLNVAKVSTPWRPQIRAGRRRLAAQAESWSVRT
jgi:hypothetical protein